MCVELDSVALPLISALFLSSVTFFSLVSLRFARCFVMTLGSDDYSSLLGFITPLAALYVVGAV